MVKVLSILRIPMLILIITMILTMINMIAHVLIVSELIKSPAYFSAKLITYPPIDLQSFYLSNLLTYYLLSY